MTQRWVTHAGIELDIAAEARSSLDCAAYADKVAQGKYDFLRTTEAYKRAMAIAWEKYGWSKKTF